MMRSQPIGAALWLFPLLAALLVTGNASGSDHPAHDASLIDRAHREGRVVITVALRPSRPGETARSPSNAYLREVARRVQAVLNTSDPEHVTVQQTYRAVAGFTALVSPVGLQQLADHPDVLRIDADEPAQPALSNSVPQIQADRVRGRGIRGHGVSVAVFDTGVRADHPDLVDALEHEECFCRPGCCPNGTSRQSGPGSAASPDGHGLHVAGIIASRGRLAPLGVAPAAALVAVRVQRDEQVGGFLSDAIAGLDWLVTSRPDVRVVNLSFGSNQLFASDCDDQTSTNMLFSELIGLLHGRGAVVVAAAGNEGSASSLRSPACIRRALSVGGVDAEEQVAVFSNSGPHLDLVAPGVQILSSGPDGLSIRSGTSMSSAHVAGAAALLISARPSATADEIEDALRSTGRLIVDGRNGHSFPRIDVFAALQRITRSGEILGGGGGRATDCLLEWSFFPPHIARERPRPVATCRDGDPACDGDLLDGQCTFLLSLCFNWTDPLLPQCGIGERLLSFRLASPRPDAPQGSVERINASSVLRALPAFPLSGANVCTVNFPFVLPRLPSTDGRGFGDIRLAVKTETRRDEDRFRFVCLPPK